jgi:hypothetical protein
MPLISRTDNAYTAPDGSKSGLIPTGYSNDIIQSAIASSLALSKFRIVRMPNGVQHMPVLDALPVAKWVTGEPNDTDGTGGEKSPTEQGWKGLVLTAEELAAIVVIPEAVIEDSSIDLWAEITPRLGEAIGGAVDAAVFAGVDKPTSWPDDITTAAIAAGNQVQVALAGTPTAANYSDAIGYVESSGYFPTDVLAEIGQRGVFRGFGAPDYLTNVRDDGRVDSIFGVDVTYDRMGGLSDGTPNTKAIVGDTKMAILGVRTDIQYKLLEEATLDVSAAQDGSAMVSLAQQDSVALRVRARFGFAVANPVNKLVPVAANRYPFAVLDEALV